MNFKDKLNQFEMTFKKLREAVDIYNTEKKRYILMR